MIDLQLLHCSTMIVGDTVVSWWSVVVVEIGELVVVVDMLCLFGLCNVSSECQDVEFVCLYVRALES